MLQLVEQIEKMPAAKLERSRGITKEMSAKWTTEMNEYEDSLKWSTEQKALRYHDELRLNNDPDRETKNKQFQEKCIDRVNAKIKQRNEWCEIQHKHEEEQGQRHLDVETERKLSKLREKLSKTRQKKEKLQN